MAPRAEDFYLQEKLQTAPPDLGLAEAFCGADGRGLLRVLYVLKAELEELLSPRGEPDVLAARVGWWREEWARLSQGRPRHPLTTRLAEHALPAPGALDPVLRVCLERVADPACQTVSELLRPAEALGQVLGAVEAAMLAADGDDGASRGAVWRDVASADLLLGLPRELAHGRAALPLDLAAELQLTRRQAVADEASARRLLARLSRAWEPAAAAPAAYGEAWIYRELAVLRLSRHAAGQPPPGPWRRLRTAWAGARRVRRGSPPAGRRQ